MLRNIDLDEISDGKLYTAGDLAKVGCQDCEGCCDCCCQMGDTIILDPLDVWQLMAGGGIIVLGTTLIPLLSTLF